MEGELSVGDVAGERGVLLEGPVHALGLGYSLMAVVIDEHILLEDKIILSDQRIVLDPVEGLALGNEHLALGRGYQDVRLDIAEGFA